MITLYHYLALSAILFALGTYGVLTRRNAIGILMSIELMMNAVNLNLVAFNYYLYPTVPAGQVFTLFVIAVAVSDSAVGLALCFSIYRGFGTIMVDEINLLKW